MYLLVIVLNKEEYLDDVLTTFVEAGIRGATIIDSIGMGRTLAFDVPIFASLRKMMSNLRVAPYNKTIFTVIKTEVQLDQVLELLDVVINFDEPGAGILFTVPVGRIKGLAQEDLGF